MRGLFEKFARNGVATNLLVALIVIGGLSSFNRIRHEVFPYFDTDLLSIAIPYPGAAPEEVERAVCARVEERLRDLDIVEQLRSVAAPGLATVTVELLPGTDADRALDDVQARLDAIEDFPEEAEKPLVQMVEPRQLVLSVAISGAADERTLRRLGEQVRDELAALDGVTRAELAAVRPYEISIEVSDQALRRHTLTFDQVADAVRGSSVDLPGGSVKARDGEILLRTGGRVLRGQEFADLTLLTREDGTRLTLGEVATVVDGFAETDQSARFDQQPAVLVQVYRGGGQHVTEIARRVKEHVETAGSELPQGIELTVWQDESQVLANRVDTLRQNAFAGLMLVLLVLALFLELRLAMWVAFGIPVAYLGTLWLMPTLGVSINVVSLFAFIVVLGIVVDDAVVVGENIYRHHRLGRQGVDAAVEGVAEVATPVFFSVLTTIAAFSPLLAVPGNVGKVMRVIPVVAIATLAFSLVESLLVLPSHLTHLRSNETDGSRRGRWDAVQGRISTLFDGMVERFYLPMLERALTWRYSTVALAVMVLLLTIGFVAGGHIGFAFFPPVEADNMVVLLTMPEGTPVDVTTEALARIEASAEVLRRQAESEGGQDIFRHVMTSVGEQPFRARQSVYSTGLAATFAGSNLGEVNIELAPAEERDRRAVDLVRRWRELTGPVAGATELTFNSSMFSAGEAINIRLSGTELGSLRLATDELKTALASYPGVFDLTDSLRAGKREAKLEITPEAESLGLTLSEVARQVRQAFYGEEAQRIQRGRDDVKVMVRYPADQRRALSSLEDMYLRTPGGDEVPFAVAGRFELVRGFATIERTDHRRTVSIIADVDPILGDSNEILADVERRVLPELLASYPGLGYSLEGARQQQTESRDGVIRSLSIAVFLIYALLAIPCRSYVQPLIVMSAIPFGIIGATWGHVLMGRDLTAFSSFGIVALTGVVVNDSLVLVDFANRALRRGATLQEALLQAGKTRFKPILLTSLTTFAGLTPLLLEKSMQAQFLIPMAISIAFGVLVSSVFILLLVPAIYHIFRDFRRDGVEH